MACNYQSKIVTSGLVLCLDAVDRKSYPGTGADWIDRSGNRNNATLVNSLSYNPNNSGTLVFDGVDDYANFFAPNLGTTTTVEMWAKIGAGYNNRMFFGWNIYDVTGVNSHIGFNTGAGDLYGISSATVTSLGLVNNWKHYVFEMRSDVSYTNNKMFVNATQQTLSQQVGTENTANRNFNSGLGRISGWRFATGYSIPMSCSTFRVYNRALTTDEIQQNFNAARGRYNL
jgi:hypothetical protein